MDHAPLNLPVATSFWLAVGTIGKVCVWAGLVFFLLAFVQQVVDRVRKIPFFQLGCAAIFGAIVSLGSLFVNDQFQYEYVWSHSEKINTIPYKIAAIWSGQQGSFLLWATCSSIFALLALRGVGPYRRGYLGSISLFLASLCGILAYETPYKLQLFEGKAFIPPDGTGLAPSLNNYWVIIHPPTIFLGFGSLVVLFAYAIGALVNRDYDGWISRVRPWSLVSLAVLGLGLCMGGFWAYETLGWGGFWMWDPVENVSFVPWTIVVALVHGIIVQTTKNKWHFTNLLLAGAPFLLFVYGTFLTRAGFLADVSVHSFATMEKSAHRVLLGLLFASIGGFLGLWFQRMVVYRAKNSVVQEKEMRGVDRASLYQYGIVFLVMLGAATAIGMSVPMFQALRGQSVKVVEEHLYHQILTFFFIPTMILMAITPFAGWRRMKWRDLLGRVLNVASITLGLTGLTMFILNNHSIGVRPEQGAKIDMVGGMQAPQFGWIVFLFAVCLFVGVANLWRLVEVMKRSKLGGGAFISHLGVAVAMAGLIVSRGFERQQQYFVQAGTTAIPTRDGGLRNLVELVPDQKLDLLNRDNKIAFKITGDGKDFVATPGLYYKVDQSGEPKPVVWPHIQSYASHDIYLALEPATEEVMDPKSVKVGETLVLGGPIWETMTERRYQIKYLELVREGEVGVKGTKFGAKVEVTDSEGHKAVVTPKMILGDNGMEKETVALDDDFSLEMASMNAADKSVSLALKYNRPVLIVHAFYKPLTILVWAGVGILTFGGLMSAWYRRRRLPAASTEIPVGDVETNEDALVSVA